MFWNRSQMLHCVKRLDYRCNCKLEISNVYDAVEGHCLQAMKIVHHHANGCFDWLISGQQNVNPSREAISILSGKYRRFTFVHPVRKLSVNMLTDMYYFDVRIAFPSGLVRSYLDFLLSFDYPLRVLIPFKVIAKGKQNEWYFKYPLRTRNVVPESKLH